MTEEGKSNSKIDIYSLVNVVLINICYLPAGRSVLSAVPKTEGTVFPKTDRPRPANNVFIIFFRRVLCKQFLC